MKTHATRTVIPALVCVAAVGALLVFGLSRNVVYFRTVSEAVHARASDGGGRLRVAGAVVPGTVHSQGGDVVFELTDGQATVEVRHHGDPPELFKDGAPVVTEGRWAGTEFSSDRLMIKHGSKYTPPAVGAATGAPAPALAAAPAPTYTGSGR